MDKLIEKILLAAIITNKAEYTIYLTHKEAADAAFWLRSRGLPVTLTHPPTYPELSKISIYPKTKSPEVCCPWANSNKCCENYKD